MFDMNLDLEHAILANKGEDDLFSIVRKNGMITMKEDAIIKSMQGTVPFEEVNTLGDTWMLAAMVPGFRAALFIEASVPFLQLEL